MNYSEKVKSEIITDVSESGARYFLCALIKCLGFVRPSKGGGALRLELKPDGKGAMIAGMFKKVFDCPIEYDERGEERRECTVTVPAPFANAVLETAGLTHEEGDEYVFGDGSRYLSALPRGAARKAFTQGLFYGCGSVYLPFEDSSKSGYQIEFLFGSEEYARAVIKFLECSNLTFSLAEKSGYYSVYTKKSQTVFDFLAYAGANDCALELSQLQVVKEKNSEITRSINAQVANLMKTREANDKYIDAVLYLEEKGLADTLDDKTKAVVAAKKGAPEDSFTTIAKKLGVSKSSVTRALNKALSTAKEIGYEQ